MNALPHDPVLPQLARALDPVEMARRFGETLRGSGALLQRCVVERVKYRPRRNASIAYRLELRDAVDGDCFAQRVAARLCPADTLAGRQARAAAAAQLPSPAGPALRLLPELDMLTWWWPNDAKLAAPRALADAAALRERWLPAVLDALGARGASLDRHRVEVVQYVPEQRLTARVDLRWSRAGAERAARVYAKSSVDPDGATVHELLRGLQASSAWRSGRLHTPAPLLWQPATQLHWQQALPGTALLDLPAARAAALAGPLGAQLAALHGVPLALARTLTPEALRARLDEVTAVLAESLPGARRQLRLATARLGAGLRRHAGAPAATLHGDLHPRNVLVDGDRLALIDLDGACRGPALLELGSWCAEGIYRAVLDGAAARRDAAAWDALLAGYARSGGRLPAAPALAWATAWSLLTQRAWRCVVNLKPGRFAIAPRLVELAAELAGATLEELA
ncbi:phosphotransferase [uncultured Piscinibacter sp.]|uniref:phosphotransferase n=1 Tax=uncultured Piscinibacter sp. TaxID=1131835 RepID=UPI002607D214|nr:phosphotransferase [uncultured Piscinibacter sp.]